MSKILKSMQLVYAEIKPSGHIKEQMQKCYQEVQKLEEALRAIDRHIDQEINNNESVIPRELQLQIKAALT